MFRLSREEEGRQEKPPIVEKERSLFTFPAFVRREAFDQDVIAVTQKPTVTKDGRLVMGVKVTEESFKGGERVQLTLHALPDGTPVGEPLSLRAGQEKLLVIKLSPELQEAWQGIRDWEWDKLPFQFSVVLLPDNT